MRRVQENQVLIVRVDGDVTDCRAVLDEVLGYGKPVYGATENSTFVPVTTMMLFQSVLLNVRAEPSSLHDGELSPTNLLMYLDSPLTYIMLLPRPLPSVMMSATAFPALENISVTSPFDPSVLKRWTGLWDTEDYNADAVPVN